MMPRSSGGRDVRLRCGIGNPPAYDALVSSGPPDDPFGESNPFKGMPIFGDLAKMFQNQGPMSWDAARQLSLSIATGGESEPNIDPLERIKIEQLARVAELQVANATGLDTSTTGNGLTIVPVTRSQWAHRSLEAFRPLFEELAGSLQQDQSATAQPEPGDPMGGSGRAIGWGRYDIRPPGSAAPCLAATATARV